MRYDRRRWQFSLSTFFVAIVVSGIAIIFGYELLRTPREVRLREYWRAKGAHIAFCENTGVPMGLYFNQGRCSDNDLREAAGIPTLQELSAPHTTVTDDGVRYLRRHPNIAILRLESTNITLNSLETFKKIPKLVVLDVCNTAIPIESIEELGQALPKTIVHPGPNRRKRTKASP